MNSEFFKKTPEIILEELNKLPKQKRTMHIKGIEMISYPSVYPSDQFRTTNFLLESIEPFLKNAKVCDLGCGSGVVGLFSIFKGASKVIQADINPDAINNAKENKTYQQISDEKLEIYLSDCFDNIPSQKFDIIVFNLPFHSDSIKISNSLEYAFFDPDFKTARKFLSQLNEYSIPKKTKIVLAFSNKGDIQTLENILNESSFSWSLWKIQNKEQKFDNRLYLLRKLK